MKGPTLLSSLPPEGALCSGPAQPDPRKRLDGAGPSAGIGLGGFTLRWVAAKN